MTIRIKRLGSDRETGEGLRIGTVRRPSRGVRKDEELKGPGSNISAQGLSPLLDLTQLVVFRDI